VWVALVELLESLGPHLDDETEQALRLALRALGSEPYALEAISKVAALLVPEAVPLMPPPATAFILGDGVPAEEGTFVAMVRWFLAESAQARDALAALATGHSEVALAPAQVLDRLLWFDSEGFRHFGAPRG
jgi:hypothetical protein